MGHEHAAIEVNEARVATCPDIHPCAGRGAIMDVGACRRYNHYEGVEELDVMELVPSTIGCD